MRFRKRSRSTALTQRLRRRTVIVTRSQNVPFKQAGYAVIPPPAGRGSCIGAGNLLIDIQQK